MKPGNDTSSHGRVRYVECNAHGELFLSSCMNYFGEAAALALRSVQVDIRALTARSGELRECAAAVRMFETLGYDDEFEIRAGLAELQGSEFTLAFELRRRGQPLLVADGQMRYVVRPSAGHGSKLGAGLVERLTRLQSIEASDAAAALA